MPKVYSASQINTFLSCGYKYKLQYIDKIKVDVVSPYLERGIRIHEKLETDTYTSDNSEDSVLLSNAMSILLTLNDQHDIFSGHKNELKLFGNVSGQRFIGIIDRVWPSQSVLLDWKTGSLKRNWKEGGYYGELDYCIQSHIYKCLCDQNLVAPIHKCYFAFLGNQALWTPATKGFEFGSEVFEAACNNAINLAIDGIKSQDFHKNKNVLCEWCDYRKVCEG